MARYAVIHNGKNIVINCILYDGAPWIPPENCYLVLSDSANINDIYNPAKGTFSASPKDE